jgi:DNA-binding SARP family transcriptional activator/tetratricopeptide (TPR) repeat protein
MLLRTLGEVRLEGAETDLSGRRKDLALLAYLARKAPRPVPRAELADLLWEDRDEARARQSLRQALLELKRVVGEGLTAGAEQARLDPQAVGLDVREFETAIAAGRLEEAVAWWEGDFLAGLEETGGESLRIWLEVEREALRRSLGFALDRLSAQSTGRGDWDQAIGWTERWSRFLPYDDRGHIRLVETLCLAGRVSEARVRHTAFLARLRSELEREPSAELNALGVRIERELSRGHALHRPGSAALFTPDMVGRSAALAELAAGWNAACSGESTVVLVEGETGIGKTRLIEEFVRRFEGSGSVLVACIGAGSAGPDGETLVEALLGRLASAPGLGAASPETLAAIAARVPKVRERFPDANLAGRTVDLDAAAAEAVSVVAEEHPVLFFVDDVERADGAARASLATLARGAVGRVLTILAVGEDDGSGPALGGIGGARPRRLKLPPLMPAEVEALVASMLVLPASERHALAGRLHEEGGGNPLYTIELAAALVDDGVLAVGERGAWTLVHPERWSVPLSGGLRTMIERRIGSLSDEARTVAEAVARLDPAEETAARAAVDLPGDRFDAGRDELIARRLLRAAAVPAGGYQFHHQLVRRAVLEQAAQRARESATGVSSTPAPKRRRRLAVAAVGGIAVAVLGLLSIRHLTARPQTDAADRRQVLVVLPELGSDSPATDSAVARSLYASLERALSTRTPPPSLVRGTLARMRRADTVAVPDRSTAREIGVRLGVRLLLVPSVVSSEGRLTAGYRVENTATGETVRARHRERGRGTPLPALADGLVGSVEQDVSAAASQVPLLEALPAVTTASLEALRAYASGERLANTGNNAGRLMLRRAVVLDSGFASAEATLAYLSWFSYDQRAAERHAAAALRSLEGLPRAESLKARLDIANALEDWPTAIDCARAIIELDPKAPTPWHTLGQLLYFNRQFTAAVEAYDSARIRTPGTPPVSLLINRATVVARVGRMEEAAKEYQEGFRVDSAMLRHPFVNHEYGAVLARLGRIAEARAAYAARLAGTPDERAAAFRSMALLEAHGGRFARARELLDDAVTGSTATGDTLGAAIGHLLRAEVVMTRGDTGTALSDLAAVESYAAAKPLPYEVLAHTVKLLARGRAIPRAAALLARLQSQTTAVSDAARARLLIARGEVLVAGGQVGDGRRAIEQALALEPTTEAKESAAFAAAAGGDLPQAAQRYDSLAADRGIDWDGHAVIELGRYLAGRAWERAGRADRARARYEGFLADWSAEPSDSNLPAVIDARRRLSLRLQP